MIGLLIISHSPLVARGVKDLADQMVKGQVPIAAAGGTLEGDLGTSIDVISAALDSLNQPSGVLVLVDMGSAVMSAEMAMEMSGLPFIISPGPLVEGAIVAATEATRPNVSLAEVAAAAARALETKGVHAAEPINPTAPPEPPPVPVPSSAPEVILTITNKAGLHMRPANLFIQTAARFKATLRARNLDRPDRPEANVKSMLEVMKLAVAPGQRIAVRAEGEDAQAALAALSELVAGNFGE